MLVCPPPEPCSPMIVGKHLLSEDGRKQSRRMLLPPLSKVSSDWLMEYMRTLHARGRARLHYRGCLPRQSRQRLAIGRSRDAALGHDSGYELGRSDVERWILYADSFRHHPLAGNMGDFFGVALLDGNLRAVGRVHIYCRKRSRHVERDVMFFGKHGDGVSSNFVGDITVGCNAVRTHNYR